MGPTENCENAKKKGKEKQRNPLKKLSLSCNSGETEGPRV